VFSAAWVLCEILEFCTARYAGTAYSPSVYRLVWANPGPLKTEGQSIMKTRIIRRGHKFRGRHADRNQCIYSLYRLGASPTGLARACSLTPGRIWQIIGEGKRGVLHSRIA